MLLQGKDCEHELNGKLQLLIQPIFSLRSS